MTLGSKPQPGQAPVFALVFAFSALVSGPTASAQTPQEPWGLCARLTAAAERSRGLPA